MNAIGKRRLLKLAAFLRTMPREKFDFSCVMQEDGKPALAALKAGKMRCGTVGCAVGWVPAVWPRVFTWIQDPLHGGNTRVVVRRGETNGYLPSFTEHIESFFALTHDEAQYLFIPRDACSLSSPLGEDATPKQVARHIERFVKRGGMPA